MRKQRLVCLLVLLPLFAPANGMPVSSQSRQTANPLLDLSGLAWVDGNRFLAVHDSKNPDEKDRLRVSFVWLPESSEGVTWKTLDVDWSSPLGISNDLESIARVPDTNFFLLVESGEGFFQGQRCRRVFQAELQGESLIVRAVADLPAAVKNIEGSAVMRDGERLFFLFAERADHQPHTDIQIAELQLTPFKFGATRKTRYRPAAFTGRNWRPVSALEIDRQGRLYIASAYDPDDDNGPFASVIWRVGRVAVDRRGRASVLFSAKPERLAVLDGLKVESLALREPLREQLRQEGGKIELFAGTDDENYGAVLRLIALRH